jgi:hypothetical protein
MADELDDFLKQAAMRRQQRQQQRQQTSNRPAAPSAPPTIAPVIRNEPPRLKPEPLRNDNVPNAQVVDYTAPYIPTVGSLSTSLPSASRPEYELGTLSNAESKPKQKQKQKKPAEREREKEKTSSLAETPATAAEPQPTAKVSAASLVQQLRDPQTLRMAIIAHEIMKRPWQ